jgi:hypothetical protein
MYVLFMADAVPMPLTRFFFCGLEELRLSSSGVVIAEVGAEPVTVGEAVLSSSVGCSSCSVSSMETESVSPSAAGSGLDMMDLFVGIEYISISINKYINQSINKSRISELSE